MPLKKWGPGRSPTPTMLRATTDFDGLLIIGLLELIERLKSSLTLLFLRIKKNYHYKLITITIILYYFYHIIVLKKNYKLSKLSYHITH